MSAWVRMPDVPTFSGATPDKEQALKPLEEAAEAFAAWQAWSKEPRPDASARLWAEVVDECADVIQATCNLLASMGVEDMTFAVAECRRRNEERGRRYDED